MNMKKILPVVVLAGVVAFAGVGVAAGSAKAATVAGTVDNVTANTIVVEGLTIFTDNNTRIKGLVEPGVVVRIKTTSQNGSPLAVEIKARDDRRAIKIEGTVDNITGNRITIEGMTVFTDNKTLIKGTITPGALVEIKARTQDDGSLLAFKIEVEDENETSHGKHIKIEGTAANVTGTNLVVDGKTIEINDATKIKGSLANGAAVEVKAIKQSDGSLLAVKIKVDKAKGRENKGKEDDD